MSTTIPLRLALSSSPLFDSDRLYLLGEYHHLPRAHMVYEGNVCPPSIRRSPDRLLSLDPALLAEQARQARAFCRTGDVIIANMEDAHPYYSPFHASACDAFAAALRPSSPSDPGFGSYGLIKSRQHPSLFTVPHAREPWRSPMCEMDAAILSHLNSDTHVVSELYLSNASPKTRIPHPGRLTPTEQEAWIRLELQRVVDLARGKPVITFINPFYSTASFPPNTPLTPADVRIILSSIASFRTIQPCLWAHIAHSNSSREQVETAILRWTSLWKNLSPILPVKPPPSPSGIASSPTP